METVRFSRGKKRGHGQTMTEFALVVPILLVLIMGVLDGALLLFSVGTARYADSEGSRVASQAGSAATADAQVLQIIRNNVGTIGLCSSTRVRGLSATVGALATPALPGAA